MKHYGLNKYIYWISNPTVCADVEIINKNITILILCKPINIEHWGDPLMKSQIYRSARVTSSNLHVARSLWNSLGLNTGNWDPSTSPEFTLICLPAFWIPTNQSSRANCKVAFNKWENSAVYMTYISTLLMHAVNFMIAKMFRCAEQPLRGNSTEYAEKHYIPPGRWCTFKWFVVVLKILTWGFVVRLLGNRQRLQEVTAPDQEIIQDITLL